MSDLIIYGASDDLIETAGLVVDELNPSHNEPAIVVVKVDDAVHARVRVEYDPDGSGEWRLASDDTCVSVLRALGDGPRDEDGCPGYSDKARIDMGPIEARRVDLLLESAG